MTFPKKALGGFLSLQMALLAPVSALAQSERALVLPTAPIGLVVPGLALSVLPQEFSAPAQELPVLAAALAAPSAPAQAPAAAPASALARVSQISRPAAAGSSPAQTAARLDAFWSGRRAAAAAVVAPAWLTLTAAKPYLVAGGVFAATYGLHRAVRWGIDRAAAKWRWSPTAVDNARFAGTLGSWAAGAAVGLHLAGATTTKLVATFGLAITLAVRNTVGNVLQGVLFLVRRPFLIGERIRVADTLYRVEDMQAQYVKLRVVAELLQDAPDKAPEGFSVVPLSQIDPLGRVVDEKGHKFAQIRASRDAAPPLAETALFNYSLLAGKSIAIYRPYVEKHLQLTRLERLKNLSSELAPRRWRLPVKPVLEALRESPRKRMIHAGLWIAAAAALSPFWPFFHAHLTVLGLSAVLPYVQAGLLLWTGHMVSGFADGFLPILARKLGLGQQTLVVVKLAVQTAIFLTTMSMALRAMGLDWNSLAETFGVSAAALSFASSDILSSIASGFMLRWDRPFDVGEFLRVGNGGPGGIVQEMNLFHVVLKPAEGMHVLVPYSAFSDNEQRTLEKP